MDNIKNGAINSMLFSGKTLAFILIFIVVISIMTYIKMESTLTCPKPVPIQKIKSIYTNDALSKVPIFNLYIKTAHNCCCVGKFKNDYVNDVVTSDDTNSCALINCAHQGVRALDFTVYSLKGNPIISASTTNDLTFKELYNHAKFSTAMLKVKRYFLTDVTHSTIYDPLFLIFRVYSNLQDTYDKMYTILQETFGVGNEFGNYIYTRALTNQTTVANIRSTRVVIIIEPHTKTLLSNSPLKNITSITLDPSQTNAPCIYRPGNLASSTNANIVLLYPELGVKNSSNYDSTKGFNNKVQFIGMNFQNQDRNLASYNKQFSNSSFIEIPTGAYTKI